MRDRQTAGDNEIPPEIPKPTSIYSYSIIRNYNAISSCPLKDGNLPYYERRTEGDATTCIWHTTIHSYNSMLHTQARYIIASSHRWSIV
jgi:hypothetical protein